MGPVSVAGDSCRQTTAVPHSCYWPDTQKGTLCDRQGEREQETEGNGKEITVMKREVNADENVTNLDIKIGSNVKKAAGIICRRQQLV